MASPSSVTRNLLILLVTKGYFVYLFIFAASVYITSSPYLWSQLMDMSFPEHTPTPLPQIEQVSSFFALTNSANSRQQICDTLNKRFNSGVTRSLAYRLFNLKQLAYLIKDNETLIQAAVEKDQGKGPFDVTLGEVCDSHEKSPFIAC